ncbi:hypothetical protein EVAR_14218_1 [Eumeta japonica]|uniref:Uncharacterized protein n=1 Tax=Eumeta variegata TaxID=151549 RepID=A0A4C1UG40_EUMVA|nr:hypothetical protein EVAR_14218_1 [Eumeta japonica]
MLRSQSELRRDRNQSVPSFALWRTVVLARSVTGISSQLLSMAITLFHYAPRAALLRVVIRACSGACAITYITFTGITYHSMLFRRLAIKLFTLISVIIVLVFISKYSISSPVVASRLSARARATVPLAAGSDR